MGARLVGLALVAALTLVMADELTRAFPLSRLVLPIPVAAMAPVAILGVVAWRPPRPLLLELGASAAGFVLAALLLVAHTPAVLLNGLLHGWADLLTGAVPAAGTGPELVVAMVVVWGAGLAGASLSLRRSHPLVPAIPALMGAVAARMLAARAPAWHPMLASGILVVLIGTLAISRLARPQVVAASALSVVVAVVAVGVTSGLPVPGSRAPFDPRTLRFVPASPCQEIDPLSELPGRSLNAQLPLFRVTTHGPSVPGIDFRMQLAVLNRYDGAQWSTSGSYQLVGSRVSTAPADPDDLAIAQQVKVLDLTGCDVPAPAGLVDAAGPALLFNPVTGALTSPGGVKRGEHYTLTAKVLDTARVQSALTGAQPDQSRAARQDLQLPPGLPPALVQTAKQVTGPATSPFGEAGLLQQWFELKGGFSVDANAPAGHTLARLAELFAPSGHVGTSEQFATAFALMGRAVGLPTRVVVGVNLGSLRPGTVTVTNRQIEAWPEVDFSGIGWVPFDSTPSRSSGQGSVPEPVDSAPAIARRVAAKQTQASSGSAIPSSRARRRAPVLVRAHPRSVLLLAANVGVVAVLLLALAGAAVALMKRWRRARRRAAMRPDRSVIGAWQEMLDRLQEHGLHVPRSATAADVVSAAAGVVARSVANRIAPAADVYNWTAFNPQSARPQHAETAWQAVDAMMGELRRTSPWRRRARAAFDPRPLLHSR